MKNTIKVISLMMCCTLFLAISSTVPAEEKITDGECDVYKVTLNELEDLMNETTAGGNLPSYDDLTIVCKPDIDIKEVNWSKENKQVTIKVEVYGKITDGTNLTDFEENFEGLDEDADISDILGMDLPDIVIAMYNVQIKTSEDEYYISYTQGQATMQSTTELMNVTHKKEGSTLTFNTQFGEAEEIKNVNVSTTYMEGSYISMLFAMMGGGSGLGDAGSFESYTDVAPNPGFSAYAIAEPSAAEVNEEIQFRGNADLGEKPYDYEWDFGDGTSSDEQNPTHKYSEGGIYTVSLTVTDNVDNTTKSNIAVNVTSQASSIDTNDQNSKNKNDGLLAIGTGGNTGLIAFIALVAIILVAGLAVLYYISKR
jgi:PKD repeat protein